jgi:hypothetical protein
MAGGKVGLTTVGFDETSAGFSGLGVASGSSRVLFIVSIQLSKLLTNETPLLKLGRRGGGTGSGGSSPKFVPKIRFAVYANASVWPLFRALILLSFNQPWCLSFHPCS